MRVAILLKVHIEGYILRVLNVTVDCYNDRDG